jgi:hypothetical protein
MMTGWDVEGDIGRLFSQVEGELSQSSCWQWHWLPSLYF